MSLAQMHLDFDTTEHKVKTSIDRLRTYCKGKRVLCAFSGGKDSQCCYHLLKESGIEFDAQYSITRFDPPEIMDFVRREYPEVKFRRAYKRSLVDDIVKMGLPNRWIRWCCTAKHTKTRGYNIAVIGVRWGESKRRASSWRMFGFKPDKTAYICPICDWSEEDVWAYLNSRGVPHCRLYDEGFKRIGCMICPLSNEAARKSQADRYPKFVNAVRIACGKRFDYWASRGWKSDKGVEIDRCFTHTDKAAYVEAMVKNWIEDGGRKVFNDKAPSVHEGCIFEGSGFSGFDGSADTGL